MPFSYIKSTSRWSSRKPRGLVVELFFTRTPPHITRTPVFYLGASTRHFGIPSSWTLSIGSHLFRRKSAASSPTRRHASGGRIVAAARKTSQHHAFETGTYYGLWFSTSRIVHEPPRPLEWVDHHFDAILCLGCAPGKDMRIPDA